MPRRLDRASLAQERLALLILYMRRVHCFNYLNCRQHRSPLDVVGEGGEAYLFTNLVLNFTQQRQPYGWQLAHAALLPCAEAYLQMLSELNRIDRESEDKVTDAPRGAP